jgi:hypothetical protein
MPFDKRLSDPSKYIDNVQPSFKKQKKIDYTDSFQAKIEDGDPPFNINRFGVQELTNKLVTRKLALNPRLNFVGDSPETYELFAGLGRFDNERAELYNFEDGRAKTPGNFKLSPDFKEQWVEAYQLSPTLEPSKKVSSPMPRIKNPDPRGYLMAAAEKRVENELEGNVSVATLLERGDFRKESDKDENSTSES